MRTKNLFLPPALFALSKLTTWMQVSFMIGSRAAFFCLTPCIVPLAGAFAGVTGSMTFFGVSLMVRMILYGGLLPIAYLVHFVPGLFAGLYWASRSMVIRLVVPLTCMGLFLIHPIGATAWFYTLYWLIPIALSIFPHKHIFWIALASTFTAHAVGSVIWLYTVPMHVNVWAALMPIVAVERIFFAIGMVFMHRVISWVLLRTKHRAMKEQVVAA